MGDILPGVRVVLGDLSRGFFPHPDAIGVVVEVVDGPEGRRYRVFGPHRVPVEVERDGVRYKVDDIIHAIASLRRDEFRTIAEVPDAELAMWARRTWQGR